MNKITMVCKHCGSEDVSRTAEADWNVERQRWELITVYDDGTCNACGGETRLIEKEITE